MMIKIDYSYQQFFLILPMQSIKLLQFLRVSLLNSVEGLTADQLLKIPAGFNNNILWNLAHLAVTQQILNYKLSNNPILVSESLVEENKKGSSPKSWTTTPDINEIKDLLISLPKNLENDYNNNLFKDFKSYKTSINFELTNIEDSISFNNFHEGLHMGTILALKRAI